MQGDIALAGFMMTADEWKALDAPSRALLMAIATKPEELARLQVHETPVEGQMEMLFAVGTAPISDEEAPR
ncbi:MAG: hypothetical protein M4D80_02285 [Myxococcota bacterium]|nr:hypothetical protein [Deltaproteobacteria bacterium]MDQ3333962.1 hypothetical protein [Myxococcota bacterium]